MTTYIALIPAIPLLGFLVLALFGQKLNRRTIGYIGAGSVGIVALLTIITGIGFIRNLPQIKSYSVVIWEWINAGNMKADIFQS
jgi:NADH-quinone oxidoreductase subunit L